MQCRDAVDVESNHRYEQYGVYPRDQTSYLTGNKKKNENTIRNKCAGYSLIVTSNAKQS